MATFYLFNRLSFKIDFSLKLLKYLFVHIRKTRLLPFCADMLLIWEFLVSFLTADISYMESAMTPPT